MPCGCGKTKSMKYTFTDPDTSEVYGPFDTRAEAEAIRRERDLTTTARIKPKLVTTTPA